MISEKNSLAFMNICNLISTSLTENDYGEITKAETKTTIYCAELPVTSNEFFNANQNGFKTQIVLVVNSDEYSRQRLVEYENETYSIYRVYKRADGYTELYCSERIGNG